MSVLNSIQTWLHGLSIPSLLIVGVMTGAGFYLGKTMKYIRLPSIIGFMLVGVILGPSLINILDENLKNNLSFITEIALGFVAVSIGLELKLVTLKKQGIGMILIIFFECFLAFAAVTAGVFLLTRDLPMALIFGAITPASAPAGTVAVIREYKAHGSLTKALYSVVAFDDGLGIIIFGFASAIAQSIIMGEGGGTPGSFINLISEPLLEIGLSLLVGAISAFLFCLLARQLSNPRDIFILTFAVVLISTGICLYLNLSFILTNMVLGIVVVNTQPNRLIQKIREELTEVMPLLFILFFVLAGANLNISVLPSLGLIGIVYMLLRSGGLMGGAWFGALVGRAERKIRKYLGLGILSQAGVAIGLALIVKHEFAYLGARGVHIGSAVITTITGTCILFEIIGPILTRMGLRKAGEIKTGRKP